MSDAGDMLGYEKVAKMGFIAIKALSKILDLAGPGAAKTIAREALEEIREAANEQLK